jgi:hypothetical protein
VFRVNRFKVWIFTLLVVGAGAATLYRHARALRDGAIAGLDARLAAGAGQAATSLKAALREAAAASALAARTPELRAALGVAEETLPRKPRGKGPAEASAAPRDDVAVQSAARVALAAAERALGGELPAGRLVLAADLSTLSRKAIGGDADALLRGATEGTARAAFARGEGRLWAAAGAPVGDGAGVVVLVPIGEAWAGAVSAASGVDVTVAGADLKVTGSAPVTHQAAITGAATKAPGKVVDVGVLAPVEVGFTWLPVQLPKVGMLLGAAPAHRARAVPVEGLKGAAVVLSVPAGAELSRVVMLQWRGLAALGALLLVGLLFAFLVKPSEIVPAVPENLVAAAARIERGEFTARAPQLAGKLGTIAAALNRAAEAAQGGAGQQGTPVPTGITQEFFNPPAPPEAEPSAFDFPAPPPPPADGRRRAQAGRRRPQRRSVPGRAGGVPTAAHRQHGHARRGAPGRGARWAATHPQRHHDAHHAGRRRAGRRGGALAAGVPGLRADAWRVRRALRRPHLRALPPEAGDQQGGPGRQVPVQDRPLPGLREGRQGSAQGDAGSLTASGSLSVKVAPRPGSDSASRLPPCSSAMRRAMARPRPVPPGLVVK